MRAALRASLIQNTRTLTSGANLSFGPLKSTLISASTSPSTSSTCTSFSTFATPELNNNKVVRQDSKCNLISLRGTSQKFHSWTNNGNNTTVSSAPSLTTPVFEKSNPSASRSTETEAEKKQVGEDETNDAPTTVDEVSKKKLKKARRTVSKSATKSSLSSSSSSSSTTSKSQSKQQVATPSATEEEEELMVEDSDTTASMTTASSTEATLDIDMTEDLETQNPSTTETDSTASSSSSNNNSNNSSSSDGSSSNTNTGQSGIGDLTQQKEFENNIQMNLEIGNLRSAQAFFDFAKKSKVTLHLEIYNALMSAWLLAGHPSKTQQTFEDMHSLGVNPNFASFILLLDSCIELSDSEGTVAVIELLKTKNYPLEKFHEQLDLQPYQVRRISKAISDVDPKFTLHNPAPIPFLPKETTLQDDATLDEVTKPVVYSMNGLESQNFYRLLLNLEIVNLEKNEDGEELSLEDKQFLMEENAIKIAADRKLALQQSLREFGLASKISSVTSFIDDWVPELAKIFSAEKKKDPVVNMYISALTTPVAANVALSYVLDIAFKATNYTLRFDFLELGVKLSERYAEMAATRARNNCKSTEEAMKSFNAFKAVYKSSNPPPYHDRVLWLEFVKAYPKYDVRRRAHYWSANTRTKVGEWCFNLVVKHVKLRVNDPDSEAAFFVGLANTYNGRKKYTLNCNPALGNLLLKHDSEINTEMIKYSPMICPPAPWTSPTSGGFYLSASSNSSKMVRTHSTLQLDMLQLSADRLSAVYDGLNALQSVAWRVNPKTLDVIIKFWNRGLEGDTESSALLIEKDKFLQDVEHPEVLTTEALNAYHEDQKNQTKLKQEIHSIKSDTQYKIFTAYMLRKQKLYFPHNLDFRGRAYPIPPLLNHLGNDFSRSLLTFYEAKPLGKEGLYWLKIHLANLCGEDKRSLDGRITFIEQNLENIFDSAKDPLGENGGACWWKTLDSPWQALAACFELHAAYQLPDPTKYKCNLPIHMDGSCNGLQHYAALGGDIIGGREVNLMKSEKPMDVYTGVAEIVKAKVKEDAEQGVMEAVLLLGKISRKVVKQTVMTSVYGVTLIGAKDQIQKQLLTIDGLPRDKMHALALYTAKLTFSALGAIFNGAKEIQTWLDQCAVIISGLNHPVKWETPLGLPVAQPYYSVETNNVKQMRNRQRSAFAPNFIHSLDSSHMLMTAAECYAHGIQFAAVHDSFWTHACDVPQMNKILREQFVILHTTPILENMRTLFEQIYKEELVYKKPGKQSRSKKKETTEIVFPPIPQRGNLDLKCVLDSPYFFD